MTTLTKPRVRLEHPGNALHAGAVTDFRQAMELYLAALSVEQNDGDEDGFWANERATADKAIALYEQEAAHAKTRTVNAFRAMGLRQYADALDAADYRSFAI